MTSACVKAQELLIIIIKIGVKMARNFDCEYSTQYVREMKFLESINIKYDFVKDINGITTYKYKKTPKLFNALSVFYQQFSQ